jgi:hypothetical protein
MFENRTKKERTILYGIIAFLTSVLLAFIHYFLQGWILLAVLIVALIEFICIFYILYLPLKVKEK